MARFFSFIIGLCAVLALCSCASFSSFEVTKNLEEALAGVEDNIQYHDRAYMKARPLKGASVVNIERLGNLKFLFAFEQGNQLAKGENKDLNVNYLSDNEWAAFKREFENAIAGSRRFPAAQMRHGLADKNLRVESRNGGNAAAELDASAMIVPDGVLHLTPMLSVSESLVGKEKTTTNTFKQVCNPLNPKNNAPLDDIQEFSIAIQSRIYQLTDRFGRPTAGFRFNTSKQLEDYHLRQGRAAIVQFFVKMYSMFPVGGKVTEIDEDGNVSFTGNRSIGLQPNMECIVCAVKKGGSSSPIPLYNASVETLSQKGNSMLKIWRKSDKPGAQKIIKRAEADFAEVCEEYDFYAFSDGFAQWPDFIDKQNTEKK